MQTRVFSVNRYMEIVLKNKKLPNYLPIQIIIQQTVLTHI